MNTRRTIQRELVMDAAKQLDHPTAEEIYDAVRAIYPSISRGTVYRNLGLLVKWGKLRKVALPDGADHFDLTLESHYHILCRGCGKVVDAAFPYQPELSAAAGNIHGFVIEEHDILFRGICPACRAGKSANSAVHPRGGCPENKLD